MNAGAGELCRLPQECWRVNGGGIDHGDLCWGCWGCWATSSPSCYQRAISTTDIMFYACFSSGRRKRTRTSVFFNTDLVTSAQPANHEGARMIQLCVAPWHRLSVTMCSKDQIHRLRGLGSLQEKASRILIE